MHVALRPDRAGDGVDILSICTGGYGLDFGVELAMPGARTVCMVEGEAFAAARLVAAMQQGLLAPAPLWSDARTFDGRAWRGCVDGLVGGIPCQPHSLAGKRLGASDDRDLWSPARRILVQSRAWFVLVENVPGMLTARRGQVPGAQRVRRDLQRLGFAVEGGLFSAAEVGASHERQRLFILGVVDAALDGRREGRAEPGVRIGRHAAAGAGEPMGDAPGPRRKRREPDETAGQGIEGRAAERGRGALGDASIARGRPVYARQGRPRQTAADADRPGLFPPGPGDRDGWRDVLAWAPQLEPAVRRVADGVASRVDELRLLGNGVVPLVAAHALRTLAARLAERGSAGAARLVRMMEAA